MEKGIVAVLFFVVLCASIAESIADSDSRYARQNYMTMVGNYHNPAMIPLPMSGGPLNVSVTFWLLDILEADVDTNQVEMLILLEKEYKDDDLGWGSVTERLDILHVPREMVWPTDIVFQNDVGTLSNQPDSAAFAEIHSDGTIKLSDKRRVRVPCQLNLLPTRYVAECQVKVESALYNRDFLWLNEPSDGAASGVMFSEFSKFELTSVSARKVTGHYSTGEFETIVTTVSFGRIPDSNAGEK